MRGSIRTVEVGSTFTQSHSLLTFRLRQRATNPQLKTTREREKGEMLREEYKTNDDMLDKILNLVQDIQSEMRDSQKDLIEMRKEQKGFSAEIRWLKRENQKSSENYEKSKRGTRK